MYIVSGNPRGSIKKTNTYDDTEKKYIIGTYVIYID